MHFTSRLFLSVTTACIISMQFNSAFAMSAPSSTPTGTHPTTTKPAATKPAATTPTKESSAHAFKPLTKPMLPVMSKPFGMPGVVGWQNGKWSGNDYLGFLSNNISISVEVLKAEGAPPTDESALEGRAREILSKENLTPQADVAEGPPLPFFHVLIIIYPVDKDKFVIFANGRLFEQIQVLRKHFKPAGYWQGITWENQDVMFATTADFDATVKDISDKLVKSFVARYRQYNPTNPDEPKGVLGEKIRD